MTDGVAIERDATRLLTGQVEFLLSAPRLDVLPEPTMPEVALAGRSNVGKSTLLNALVGRKAIARASNTPGRTQELNVFEIGDPLALRLIDMPGYGFAKAPVATVERWQRLVRTFLRGRPVLARTLLLIDARRGIGPADRAMMDMLDEAAVGYRAVLTKADKLKASALERVEQATAEALRKRPAAYPALHVTSAEKGLGIDALRVAVCEDALGSGWRG